MSAQRLPITFAAVARRAGVSTDFLYRHPVLRSKIASVRNTVVQVPQTTPEATESTSAAVRALSVRLKELAARHRADADALERALAAAQGESLLL